jgi:uncharacterized Tic20 family protein
MEVREVAEMTKHKPDERIAAALAHGLIVTNWMGAIAAAIIWLLEKEKSKYVAFQALQALVYQFVGLLIWIAWFFCYMATLFGGIGLATLLNPRGEGDGIIAFFSFAPICGLFLLWALFILYGLYGAYVSLLGRDFRYLIVGALVERYMKGG